MVLDLIHDGKNVIIFDEDNSSSTHTDNRTKHFLALGEGSIQKLDNTTITAEARYSFNLTATEKKFCGTCSGTNSSLHVNGVKIHRFKVKDSEIKPDSLCLGNISKHFTVDSMKKTELNGYVMWNTRPKKI